jgi:hypothetical protein
VIDLPRRSVTRFFIPLIDVLILLFCMFLLLPFVSKSDDQATGPTDPTDPVELQRRLKETEDKLTLKEEEVRRLLAERAKVAERTLVRVLEIDADTGELYHFSREGLRPERVKVATPADAAALIRRTQQTEAEGKQAYFLILYPRTRSRFPTEPQVTAYADWFKDVPHKFDNPFAAK